MGHSHSHSAAPSKAHNGTHANFIPDKIHSYDELQAALREAGLESSQLILGIDFTKSNTWTGERTFAGKCLHHIEPGRLNPYQRVVDVLGRTLEPFDDDHKIPVFGFGDETTKDRAVFPFFPDRYCHGFQEALQRYTEIAPMIKLSGPTNFGPLIRESIRIVRQTREYHILLIIADGQVTDEKDTADAIVEASNYPISIIMIGVGDGPWEKMEEFDDGLPKRRFDNFQFCNFHEVLTKYDGSDVAFAVMALQEVPEQFAEIRRLKLL